MLLSALPVPPELSLMAHGKHFTQHPTSRKKLNEIRKLVEDMIKQNKIHYQLLEVSQIFLIFNIIIYYKIDFLFILILATDYL